MLEAANLHKVYNHSLSRLHVLKGIDLSIKQGDFLSIIGPSGAGKSTLLHILGGLDKPTEGKVLFEGKEVYALNDKERSQIRNQKIGFVFQFYHLLPEFTALENVILPAIIRKDTARTKSLEEKGLEILEKVGLRQRAGHKPSQLSGGEQQRVAIARALINDPSIIFCDEPTGNLDSESGLEILKLLRYLNEIRKQTLVVVTHDEIIAQCSAKILQIRDGRLVKKD